jgi:hypothetical protein
VDLRSSPSNHVGPGADPSPGDASSLGVGAHIRVGNVRAQRPGRRDEDTIHEYSPGCTAAGPRERLRA